MSDKYVSSKGLDIRSFGKALNICESINMKPIKYLWNIRRGPWATSLTLETVPSKNKKKTWAKLSLYKLFGSGKTLHVYH